MTFPKSSANKKSALFDVRPAFNTNAVIGIVSLVFTVFEFIIVTLNYFSDYINNAFSDIMTEIPASALSVLGNAEYLERSEKTPLWCARLSVRRAYIRSSFYALQSAQCLRCALHIRSKKRT